MTKQEFLNTLKNELRGLDQKDIDEIIGDQEEFIRDAMSAGRSESEVISSLGSPKAFADSLKLEYKVNKINNASSTWESYKEVFGSVGVLVALAPINIILFFGPILAILSFLFGWIMGSGAIVMTGLLLIPILFVTTVVVGLGTLPTLACLFLGITIIALGLMGVSSFILMSQLFIRVFTAYAKWNIDLVNGRRA